MRAHRNCLGENVEHCPKSPHEVTEWWRFSHLSHFKLAHGLEAPITSWLQSTACGCLDHPRHLVHWVCIAAQPWHQTWWSYNVSHITLCHLSLKWLHGGCKRFFTTSCVTHKRSYLWEGRGSCQTLTSVSLCWKPMLMLAQTLGKSHLSSPWAAFLLTSQGISLKHTSKFLSARESVIDSPYCWGKWFTLLPALRGEHKGLLKTKPNSSVLHEHLQINANCTQGSSIKKTVTCWDAIC